MTDPVLRAALASSVAALLASCPQPGATSPRARAATPVRPSGVVSRTDFTKGGKPACNILFRYAGHEPETLFWIEPCTAVTTRMMSRADLEAAGKWARLDAFDRRFVAALPGGRVLYVAGSVTASIYPIGTNGLTYDIPVAD